MKKIATTAFVLVAFVLANFTTSFAANDPEHGDYVLVTVKELKERYADIRIDPSLNLLDTDEILVNASPCAGEMPCGGALAAARHEAEQLANDCCCVRYFGVICCDPSTGSILQIEGIAMPNSPQCN